MRKTISVNEKIKVVSFKICPFVQRVTAALEAMKLSYDVDYISLKNKPQWFLDISPTGQVPVLITGAGVPLFESDPLVEYLDDEYPKSSLEPNRGATEKAQDRAWSIQASKHYLVQCGAMGSSDEETLLARSEKLHKAFARIEAQLGEGPYYKGRALSNVDIAWLPLLHRAAIILRRTGYEFIPMDRFPKVKAWQTALMETDIPERSVPADFEEAFAGFYLSDKTYLGSLDLLI